MITIYKYQLSELKNHIAMPKGAQILCVQTQYHNRCLWAEVDDSCDLEMRDIRIFGTGWEIDEGSKTYIGTYQQDGFVGHVYEYKG